jgi:hypothetical protein
MREFAQRWASWFSKGGVANSLSHSVANSVSHLPPEIEHHVKATCFADESDVARFKACKEAGGSDEHCFEVGDNGEGAWGDDTTTDEPICALPPEDMIERWGSCDAAYRKKVLVAVIGRSVICSMKEKMPHRRFIKNGAGIDLNPAAIRMLGRSPGPNFSCQVAWRWLV